MAMVLVIEGLFPLVSPVGWRHMFAQLLQLTNGQIRFFALGSVLTGLLLIWFLAP